MNIRQLVHTPPVTCAQTAPIWAVARLMEVHDVGSVVLLDDYGAIAGIVTDRDLVVRAMADHRDLDTPVAKVMTKDLICVRDDSPLLPAANDTATDTATAGFQRMLRLIAKNIRHAVILEDDRVVGVVSARDLFRVVTNDLLDTWT